MKARQLPLFASKIADDTLRNKIARNGYELNEIDIGDITFQSGQNESIHRWYRLTPSFSPSLVRFFVKHFGIKRDSIVLDPFCGKGTTLIECQKLSIPGIGVEINPLFHIVGTYSLLWSPVKDNLFDSYIDSLTKKLLSMRHKSVEDVLLEESIELPGIHNIYRWWKPEVLKGLLVARQLIHDKAFEEIYHYLWLALCSASLECANIHRNHPTITFDDNHTRSINVLEVVKRALLEIQEDLLLLSSQQKMNVGLGKSIEYDSCKPLNNVLQSDGSVTHIITSPPYPNRFSYIHQTRPQLYFMEVIESRVAATEIDLQTIGGTWGRATSNLQRNYIEPEKELQGILDYVPELRAKSLLMCNYATKYFTDLHRHISNLRRVVRKGFRGAYVVGNSRLNGVDIFTETILAQIFELNGFKIDNIILFRKRGGRQKIYETAVCFKS